jgi:hypothetical protein
MDLSESLAVFSDELYNKSTHFLLELIQNADDNSYTSKNPTLNFTYRKGRLRVDCNEVGFSPGNVRAICGIGNSTKSSIRHSTRYISEKGIGFKSVFRVANVVFISSRHFSFKFDRTKTIGMIAPIWEEFPEKKSPDHTSFYLQLLGEPTESEVVADIQTLDPRILIFLRQLREINLSITCADGKTRTQNLRRVDWKDNGIQITTLHYDAVSWDFIVKSHLVSNMPGEPKRPGCSVSEILIAFPILNYKSGPQKDSQSVYAFLPIRDYGFRFLLQGDFLLTANREGIDKSLRWNRAICNAAVDAFVNALDLLISGDLKHYWPQYLPIGKVDLFFRDLKDGIFRKLKEKAIIESCAGGMAKPSDLFYPPPGLFRDDTGVPFTMTASTKSKFLSAKYPDWAIDPLLTLGVKEMTERDFLNELKQMILKEPKIFQEKPKSWHSQLAKALLPLATVKEHQNVLVDMKLIPLRDVQTQTGELVTATGAALQTLDGHSNVVSAVAFSPNGKQVAWASEDNTINLWDPMILPLALTLEQASEPSFLKDKRSVDEGLPALEPGGSKEGIEPRVKPQGPFSDSGYTSMPSSVAPSTSNDDYQASIHVNQNVKQLVVSTGDEGDNQSPENYHALGVQRPEAANVDLQSVVSDQCVK